MANPALLLDYLFVQALLEQRLKDVLQMQVEGHEALVQLDSQPLKQDTLFVMWLGDRFPDTAAAGASTIIGQQWLVTIGVQDSRQHDDAARNRRAGPLMAQVHKAIAGWAPEGAFRPFKRIQGPKPSYRANAGLYPLAFEISLNL